MENRTEQYVKMIREGIGRAQYDNFLKKSQEIRLKADDFAGNFKKDAKLIIDHVKRAHAEIYLIEHMENKALQKVNKNINDKLKRLSPVLKRIIEGELEHIDDLKDIVSDLIDDTGPKKDSTFLLLNVKRTGMNFIIRHSINVCLIAIATAIELSKMMTAKLNDDSVKGDFKKLTICNKKIFNKFELTNLGIAALLHDIGLLDSFPKLAENTQFGIKDKSKIELHTTKAYHLLTRMKMDYEIRRAVLQHHEFQDGSGYPDGIKARLFTKYSIILSFANHLEYLTAKNPFIKKLHPHKAIMQILTTERIKFDNDVILAYCKAASIYPIGSWLSLSNHRIGLVIRTNKMNLKKPIVKCVYTSDMKELLKKEFIDMSKSSIKIQELIDIESLELLDQNVEKYIFDEREFIRHPVNIDAKVNLVDSIAFFSGNIIDLSGGGARIVLENELKLGDEIILNYDLNKKKFNNIKGLVVWANGHNAGSNQYGVRFLDLDEKHRKLLLKIEEY